MTMSVDNAAESEAPGERTGRIAIAAREFHTLLLAAIVAVAAVIGARLVMPVAHLSDIYGSVDKFVGPAWPFFAAVALFLCYGLGAWMVESFRLGAPRNWHGIDHALHWATEACPMVGLLTTFYGLLLALFAYSEAGPGKPETQAAFIANFALAFGSSIAGGVLSLVAFTLHRLLPQEAQGDQK